MTTIIKIKCNGPGKCVNEIDLEKTLGNRVSAYKGIKSGQDLNELPPIPASIVLDCRKCAVGKIIITREMVEQAFRDRV